MSNLLVELCVEELPPKALKMLGEAFAHGIAEGLMAQGLIDADAQITSFATPRRLAVHLSAVRSKAPDSIVQQKLMPMAVALDPQGRPTAALLKKLDTLGLGADALQKLKRQGEGKAEALFLDSVGNGATLLEALQRALDDTLAALPIPKLMSYQLQHGDGPGFQSGWTTVNFVRPAHSLVALHGKELLPLRALGLQAGRSTQGHRFEALAQSVEVQSADSYASQLRREGSVVASFDERRTIIVDQLKEVASSLGLQTADDAALLDEVTALVERPNVILCQFDRQFLSVPAECLILTMKSNQKYFPLLDSQGLLTHQFLVVSNISPIDTSAIRSGNERVVRARLADAKFFFDQDRKKTLHSRVAGLGKVVYHNKLGTQLQRSERVRRLAANIASQLGNAVLVAATERAALLAKADLLTDMVGEFPELQGIMGGYYARHDGESDDVALAVEDHYRPRFAGDILPRGQIGLIVALADKLETLAGLFGIAQWPTGDKDPFALRRHALGVIRILVERELPLAMPQLLQAAFAIFPEGHGNAQAELAAFMQDRAIGYLRDRGFRAKEIEAVLQVQPPQWAELPRRLTAVRAFAALPEAAALAAANKRVGNILKKSEGAPFGAVDIALLTEKAEAALYQALQLLVPQAEAFFAAGDYAASLRLLAGLRVPVDAFFNAVMVNAEDAALRRNRLSLLGILHTAMNRVADLSRLAS